ERREPRFDGAYRLREFKGAERAVIFHVAAIDNAVDDLMCAIADRTGRRDDRKARRIVRGSADPDVVEHARRKQVRQLLANEVTTPQSLEPTDPIGAGRILKHVVKPRRLKKYSTFRRWRTDGRLYRGPRFVEETVPVGHGARDRTITVGFVVKCQRRRDDA